MPTIPTYEVIAVRYAVCDGRRNEHFIVSDPHDSPMPMDFFVWVVRDEHRTFLIDTGFNERAAYPAQRTFWRCPVRALELLGITPDRLTGVILTHLHFDHAGNLDLLPQIPFHLQERELHYAVGRSMQFDVLRSAYRVDDVLQVVRGVYDRRMRYAVGDEEVAPGLQVVHIGGHTGGLQAVRVHTRRGWIVLASDASHYYENAEREVPFPIVLHFGDLLEGTRRLLRLCESPDHFIPGHDPLVMRLYPSWGDPALQMAALHQPPVRSTA